ncbi:MAG: glycosyltransferase family 4 protein, partial [Rhodanobacteraceae bacterium]
MSTSYPRGAADWRGIFMAHISAALARRPDLSLAQWAPPGDMDHRVDYAATPEEAVWLATLMQRGGISHLLRSKPVAGLAATTKLLRRLHALYRRRDDDLYHVNWLQCALPLPADGKPALMTVLGNDMRLLRLPAMRGALRRVMKGRSVVICPNAAWMEAPLRMAFGDRAAIVPVPFGIDPRWYAIERTAAELCRPPRWLAVTRLTANKLGSLFEWSAPLFADRKRELHLFGPMQEQVPVPDWVHYHGSATPEQLASEWFPHAHGLITLSRHAEGRPQVMLEAMASALPIIASRMPAHADIVSDGATGALCDMPDAYAAALVGIENPDTNLRMGAAARAWVTREIGTWD